MSVPFVDLEAEQNEAFDDLKRELRDVFENQRYLKGPKVKRFEEEWSEYIGVDHAVAVSSGTTALELALQAHDIGRGDHVILPPTTFRATAEAVMNVGARPFFPDVDPETGHLDLDDAEQYGHAADAIIPVDLYGFPIWASSVNAFANKHDLTIIEDAAQAHGAQYLDFGRKVGNAPWTCTWSFYPSKNLGASGDAGAVTTPDEDIARRIRELRNHGYVDGKQHGVVGTNARMDEVEAATLLAKLPYLDQWNQQRLDAACTYMEMIWQRNMPVEHLTGYRTAVAAWHLFPVLVPRRNADDIVTLLEQLGIQAGRHYSENLSACSEFPGLMRHTAERWASSNVTLPMFPHITVEQQEEVIRALDQIL